MKKRFLSGLAVIFLLIVFAGCAPAEQSEVIEPTPASEEIPPTPAPTELPTPKPTIAAAEKATYEIYFDATWSAETHPADYVASAHFSPFIAYGHTGDPDALIFSVNGLATAGIEQMAETGATELLEGELQAVITAGFANDFIKGARIDSPGTASGKFGFSQEMSHITFVSMIAPSPDWFVAASVDLFEDGQWAEELTLDLITYDSGTDSGLTLTAEDADTQPREPITRMPENLQNMGTLTLIRVD